ncbi:MAG: acyl-ACP--UDP-N-acetylglucosamine O-acyltransferase [Gammaproteobacteria bacterium]|nr:acyl-ACP--UDP-N-acetylglucosamine O-acyltransferase [Gammaproteobacteria bacterium]
MSAIEIHPTALVAESAELGAGVSIGPYSIIGSGVEVGAGCEIGAHVVIKGPTRLGQNNRIYAFASIGEDPQDKKFGGEETWLEIGNDNTIREYCTLNRGTADGGGVTRIGDGNWIMAYVHVAHDCRIGNRNTLANGASLAGHVTLHNNTVLGGFTLVHQFCAIGSYVMSAIGSGIVQDVPPYIMVAGNSAEAHGINREGLLRAGFDQERLQRVKRAYRTLFRAKLSLKDAIRQLQADYPDSADISALVTFLQDSTRGIVR